MLAIGDLVVRKSHNKDIVFKITDIATGPSGNTLYFLKGLHLRLFADAPVNDLERVSCEKLRDELLRAERINRDRLDRVDMRRNIEKEKIEARRAESIKKYSFFDIPGRVLHIDGDDEYLGMCLKTYGQLKIQAVGKNIEESKQPEQVASLLKEYRPDILVLTGHDALIGNGKKDFKDINNYRTSKYFVQAVRNARMVESSRDDLVIFAGACQSHFEAILDSGANFASSPTRVFIHAYDPVFIAEKVAFTPINEAVDIGDAITASVTGIDGVGGVQTLGKFRVGLPKSPYC